MDKIYDANKDLITRVFVDELASGAKQVAPRCELNTRYNITGMWSAE